MLVLDTLIGVASAVDNSTESNNSATSDDLSWWSWVCYGKEKKRKGEERNGKKSRILYGRRERDGAGKTTEAEKQRGRELIG